jgi:hypothetical protein
LRHGHHGETGMRGRLISSIRRDCLDHFVVIGECYLCHLLKSYQKYYNKLVRISIAAQGRPDPARRPDRRSCAGRTDLGRTAPSIYPGMSFRPTGTGRHPTTFTTPDGPTVCPGSITGCSRAVQYVSPMHRSSISQGSALLTFAATCPWARFFHSILAPSACELLSAFCRSSVCKRA